MYELFAYPLILNSEQKLILQHTLHSNSYYGSTGGNADDMIESLKMSSKGLINPAVMVTHVGGLNCSRYNIKFT